MPKRKKRNRRVKFEDLGISERWEDGERVTEAKILNRKTPETEEIGISIRMGKKAEYLGGRPRFGKGIWITEKIDISGWLRWLIDTIKKLYYKAFKKRVEIEEISFWKTKVKELTEKLAEAQTRVKELEQKEEEKKKLYELAEKVIDQFQKYKEIFNKFVDLIEKSCKENLRVEEQIKNFIKENRWLLGLECEIEAKNKRIDASFQIDLHVVTKYNQNRIFELKSPNLKPFKIEGKRILISKELAEGLSELIRYMKETDIYSRIKSSGTYGIHKPTGVIVIGFKLSEEEQHFLDTLNFFLYPHIQVITYQDLIENSKRELSLLEDIKSAKS
jgi:hypothetical protein